MKKKGKRKYASRIGQYRPINHPAVGAVVCPYCHASIGVPCRVTLERMSGANPPDREYVQTHMARVNACNNRPTPAPTPVEQAPAPTAVS